MSRRDRDYYRTPSYATQELVKYLGTPVGSPQVLDPCAGDGAIGEVLSKSGYTVHSSDIDPKWGTRVADAREERTYVYHPDWVITNPPFSCAFDVLKAAYAGVHPERGSVALLLRLSFLEPTKERGQWLAANPPTRLLVLPRISFTGDGKTDSVTCAWMIWDRPRRGAMPTFALRGVYIAVTSRGAEPPNHD